MASLYVIFSVVLIPVILGSWYANSRVNRLFHKYSREPLKKGITGGRLARTMLDSAGLSDVIVEEINAPLHDHYDPRQRVVRLSRSVSRNASVAAIGIAAHEAAHAMQHGTSYPPAMLRDRIAPLVEKTGHLVFPLLVVGILLGRMAFSPLLVGLALFLFLGIVFFCLVTLPVEFEASSRAVRYIRDHGVADKKELDGVQAVLRAAALTYVAALALTVVQFLGLLGMLRRK